MLTGTGTAGAYHAGVLRAIQEAGVKVDIVAGRGVGVIGVMCAAIDGSAHLWERATGWASSDPLRFYRWRPGLRAAAWALGVAFGALLLPLAVLVGAMVAYPLGFLLRLVGVEGGATIAIWYAELVTRLFEPGALPVYLPQFVTVALLLLVAMLGAEALRARLRTRARRRSSGTFWWRLLGAPLDVTRAVDWGVGGLWQIMRGAARVARPAAPDLAERYAELLDDNVGQLGFRELVVLVHDLDARRDLVFALLAEPYRRSFFRRRVGSEGADRHLEIMNLAGPARRHVVDALTAALCLPVATEPHLVSFATDSPWGGETHRVCDRPEALSRLLDEVASAGVEQVILVTAVAAPTGPHTLAAGRHDARGRTGEYLAALETTAIHDALASRGGLFQAVFQIRPTHNPLGTFEFNGCYDERSDRRLTLAELVDRGYEDGFRQFVDSVVGASGEWIEPGRSPGVGHAPEAPTRT